MVSLAAVDSLIGKVLQAGINRRAEAVGRAVPSCMKRMLGSLRPFIYILLLKNKQETKSTSASWRDTGSVRAADPIIIEAAPVTPSVGTTGL